MFMPDIASEDLAAEFQRVTSRPLKRSRPLFSLRYVHDGYEIIATVGRRREMRAITMRSRGFESTGEPFKSGEIVVAIVEGNPTLVFQQDGPDRKWSNPTLVGRHDTREAVPFDGP